MQCEGCALGWRRNPVYGAGSCRSGIAFIGEMPGDGAPEPLVGTAGWWFRNLLGDAGLSFDDVYRTTAVMCASGGKGDELKGAAWTAVYSCGPSLRTTEVPALIEQGIKVFVPMGNAALQALMPHLTTVSSGGKTVAMGIIKARGYVYPLRPCAYGEHGPDGKHGPNVQCPQDLANAWVIPTLTPSPKNLKGKGSGWALFVSDVRKAMRVAAHGPRPRTFTRLSPTYHDLKNFVGKGPRPLTSDVESTMDGRLVCVGFCDGEETIVVPVLQQGGSEFWSPADWLGVRDGVQTLLSTCRIAFQNGVHDMDILERAGFRDINWTVDTMSLHHACYPDQLHSLHHLGSLYHEGPPWKETFIESTAPEEMD